MVCAQGTADTPQQQSHLHLNRRTVQNFTSPFSEIGTSELLKSTHLGKLGHCPLAGGVDRNRYMLSNVASHHFIREPQGAVCNNLSRTRNATNMFRIERFADPRDWQRAA